MALELAENSVQSGEQLHGRISLQGKLFLRLRGEVSVSRLLAAPMHGDPPRWSSRSHILVWTEFELPEGATKFQMPVPADCPPSVVGHRHRIDYHLELHAPAKGLTVSLPIRLLPMPTQNGGPVEIPLEKRPPGPETSGGEAAMDLDDLVHRSLPQSWLEELTAGNHYMNRILARTVRGKLLEPEELLALQASMYRYSRTLVKIQDPKNRRKPPKATPAMKLEIPRAGFRAGDALKVRLFLPPGDPVESIHLRLVRTEGTSWEKEEELFEATLATWEASSRAEEAELRFPGVLQPSCQTRVSRLEYRLEGSVKSGSGHYFGQSILQITQ